MNLKPQSRLGAATIEMGRLLEALGGWPEVYRLALGIGPRDWENMPIGEAVQRLRNLLRPDANELDGTDQIILEAMPVGSRINGREIADAVNHVPSYDTVRKRLSPNAPLLEWGFVVKAGGQGYIRKM